MDGSEILQWFSANKESAHSLGEPQALIKSSSLTLSEDKINLHWQLCPSTVLAGKRLCFDVTKSIEKISIYDFTGANPIYPLSFIKVEELMRKAASNSPLRDMVLLYAWCPQWRVHIARPDGDVLRVRDVFQALYNDVRKTVDEDDLVALRSEQSRSGRYHDLLSQDHNANFKSIRLGMRRVDLMAGDTWFLGLTRPDRIR